MKRNISYNGLSLLVATAALFSAVAPAQAQDKKPNILFIMGDDIGWMQPSCYHRGLMVGETPNIDRIAKRRRHVHALLRRVELHGRAHGLLHRNASVPRGHGPAAVAGRHFVSAPRHAGARPVPVRSGLYHRRVRQEPSGRSIRIPCRRRTASRNSGVTSITWMRCSR